MKFFILLSSVYIYVQNCVNVWQLSSCGNTLTPNLHIYIKKTSLVSSILPVYYYVLLSNSQTKGLKVLFCVFQTPKYCCLSHKVLIKKDMFKFLDAVSSHLKVSLKQNFLFAGQPWWHMVACKKSVLFKTHRMLPFISRIGPGPIKELRCNFLR